MNRKVIAVSFVGGRVGSSLVMGLLEKSGISVGNVDKTYSTQNEKGFYEINEYNRWLRKEFPFVSQFMPHDRNFYGIAWLSDTKQKRFKLLINKWFKNKSIIAIKAPYYFPVYLFDDSFDLTIISLKRKVSKQADSIEKWNTEKGDFKKWLKRWYKLLSYAPKPDCETLIRHILNFAK